MIEELNIRNFALIDSLNLSLDSGFSVLTGETGAGKSIIAGSISFLLGSKADTEIIRTGCEEAGVSSIILVDKNNQEANEWLKRRDINTDDSRIVVRRNIKLSGRNSIYIQNVPVTRNDLAEFMSFLFDLHGQHTHESLLRKETHRSYLDHFSGLETEAADFNHVFSELSEKRKTLDVINTSARDREARLDILNYAVEEITRAAPKKGEIKELEAEAQRLGDFEKLSFQVNNAASSMYDGETSLLSNARKTRTALENAASIDSSLSSILKRFEDLYYEADDLAAEFRSYRGNLNYDPARLEEVEERLSLLSRLKKKYRHHGGNSGNVDNSGDLTRGMLSDEDDILLYKAEAEAEIEALSGAEENQDKLKAEISRLEKDITLRASSLSTKRKEGAKTLGEKITGILFRLGMPNALFSVRVSAKTKEGGGLVCGPWGADDVEFLFSANKGEPEKELARIASGGELSRVMLAIKTILCGEDKEQDNSAETLVFDEIDTGIGGEVALSVGEYLARIGKGKQIFCVTHLASIAVRADNHLKVDKKLVSDGGGKERTVTVVSRLDNKERRLEIARMLAGESGSAALAHADELLAKYGIEK